jgi:hypothetical protein
VTRSVLSGDGFKFDRKYIPGSMRQCRYLRCLNTRQSTDGSDARPGRRLLVGNILARAHITFVNLVIIVNYEPFVEL